jgi:hypothetical protein
VREPTRFVILLAAFVVATIVLATVLSGTAFFLALLGLALVFGLSLGALRNRAEH